MHRKRRSLNTAIMDKDLSALNVQTGANLANLRMEKNMSQEQLAGYLGINRNSVVNIEAGRQGLTSRHLLNASIALDVDIRAILPSKEWFSKNKDKKVRRRVVVEIIDESE